MEISFEALREAGIRMPKQMGAAVSIVGALVIGQAAVQAGLVSAPMVIIVAITGISSFMIPRYAAGIAIRMLRFPIMLLASYLRLTWHYDGSNRNCLYIYAHFVHLECLT